MAHTYKIMKKKEKGKIKKKSLTKKRNGWKQKEKIVVFIGYKALRMINVMIVVYQNR